MKLNTNTISEKMKSVKASCGGAPFGEKKNAGLETLQRC